MSPGKIASPRAHGYWDDAGQIDRQHHSYFAGRAQTQSGQVLSPSAHRLHLEMSWGAWPAPEYS